LGWCKEECGGKNLEKEVYVVRRSKELVSINLVVLLWCWGVYERSCKRNWEGGGEKDNNIMRVIVMKND
jgi:hypothetical protein